MAGTDPQVFTLLQFSEVIKKICHSLDSQIDPYLAIINRVVLRAGSAIKRLKSPLLGLLLWISPEGCSFNNPFIKGKDCIMDLGLRAWLLLIVS